MSTHTTSILGIPVSFPAPYAEGMPMGTAEAQTLNQTVGQNVCNLKRKAVKEMLEKAGVTFDANGAPSSSIPAQVSAEVVTMLAAAFAEYTLAGGGARGPRGPSDEFKKDGVALARVEVEAALKAAGQSATAKQTDELANELYGLDRDRFVTMVEKQRKAASAKLDTGLLARLMAAKAPTA